MSQSPGGGGVEENEEPVEAEGKGREEEGREEGREFEGWGPGGGGGPEGRGGQPSEQSMVVVAFMVTRAEIEKNTGSNSKEREIEWQGQIF